MSAFLGPIHHWMYKKIQVQEQINEDILIWNQKEGICPDLRMNADETVGVAARGELAEIIDTTQIHAWLQNQVNIVENRYSFIVLSLIDKDEENLNSIKDIVKKNGKNIKEDRGTTPEEIFKSLSNILLDGMPCDRAVELLSADSEIGIIEVHEDLHEKYWAGSIFGAGLYKQLRNVWIDGYLLSTDFEFNTIAENRFAIKRRSNVMENKDAIDVLMEEHTHILEMGKVIRSLSLKALRDRKVDTSDLYEVVEFIREYADRLHHAKEEKILFHYMMDELGDLGEKLIRNGMLVEHDLARLHIATLNDNITRYKENPSDENVLGIIVEAMGWVNMLHRHIDKEDNAVYTFAKRSLKPETIEKINIMSKDYENEGNNLAESQKYIEILRKLQGKYS